MKDIWIGAHFQNFRISLQYSSHLGKKNTPLTWPNKNNSTHLKTRRCDAVQCVSVQFCLFFLIICCLLSCVVSCFALCCLLLHCVECCLFLFCFALFDLLCFVSCCVVLCVANQPSVQCSAVRCLAMQQFSCGRSLLLAADQPDERQMLPFSSNLQSPLSSSSSPSSSRTHPICKVPVNLWRTICVCICGYTAEEIFAEPQRNICGRCAEIFLLPSRNHQLIDDGNDDGSDV